MLHYLLDTDHLTLYEQGHSAVVTRVDAQPKGVVGITAVTAEEALRGRLAPLARAHTGLDRIRRYALFLGTIKTLHEFPLIAYDQQSEDEFLPLTNLRTRVGTQDLKIAAIALANKLTLLTRNRGHFSLIPGLVLDDWTV